MTEALTIIAAIALFAAFVWAQISADRANKRLRRNAFLTDERGVRVKYVNASRDVRERAEAN